jgi:YbbR domain-containing protein
VTALTRNWGLKLLALCLAVALWLFVVTAEKSEVVVSMPLELHSLPAGLEVVGERPESVEVQLIGVRTSLARVSGDQARARLSLDGVKSGEVVLQVLPEHLTIPRGVTALRINPATVRVTIDASRSSRVKVLPRLSGIPASGHRVASVSVNPDEVEISGPASQVDRVGQVFTEPVDIGGESGRLERSVGIAPTGGAVRVAGARTVRVVVDVVGNLAAPAGGGGAPAGSSASPERRSP